MLNVIDIMDVRSFRSTFFFSTLHRQSTKHPLRDWTTVRSWIDPKREGRDHASHLAHERSVIKSNEIKMTQLPSKKRAYNWPINIFNTSQKLSLYLKENTNKWKSQTKYKCDWRTWLDDQLAICNVIRFKLVGCKEKKSILCIGNKYTATTMNNTKNKSPGLCSIVDFCMKSYKTFRILI